VLSILLRRLALCAAAALPVQPAAAQAPNPIQQALAAASQGPKDIALGDQALLKLPEGKLFVPAPQAGEVLRAMGNPGEHKNIHGLVFPVTRAGWFAVLRWEAAGYVKDDDAKNWDAEALLKSYREGTEASNAERRKLGGAEMEIVGWAEPPHYDAASHRLVWAMSSRDKGSHASPEQGVNYNTFALGREGYLSLNLVTDLNSLPTHKSQAQELLGALQFVEGKRYADFNSRTDKVAEYGLAALVLGVGAKKLGLFAVMAAFVLKFAKLFLLGGIGLLALLGKWLGRNKAST